MSHLANADDPDDPQNLWQIEAFDDATRSLGLERSMANSAAVIGFEHAHYEWVRPGIMLYGASPLSGKTGPQLGLEPVMTVTTRILTERRFERGQPVGYGGTWICSRETRAAILSCGYGDGYPRGAASGTPVRFREGVAPIIGRISMDSMAVDITDLGDVDPSQRVVLFGRGLSVDEVALRCDTISYELFCRLGPRAAVPETAHGES